MVIDDLEYIVQVVWTTSFVFWLFLWLDSICPIHSCFVERASLNILSSISLMLFQTR